MQELERPAPAPALGDAPAFIREARTRARLIVALDFPSGPKALDFVERLDGACQWFKVGLELYLSAGGAIVSTLREDGYSVFLDLKFHDIPNTVAGAIRSVGPLGAQLLTIHASGGPAMLAAAAEAASSLPDPPQLLAVTVLTSMDQAQLNAIGIAETPGQQALALARMAYANGVHGFVCSPEEAANLRDRLPDATLVTPGIRPAGASVGDQKRIATPAAALAAGADYLVVGRPITEASKPADAANAILMEMAEQSR
jgi:orotidine-5'-phosphate decarboxylase